MKAFHYDVIIIGGGHAGTEAALASARLGAKSLLVTHSIETLGQMSCNPAIGGIGKGHLVKEIDALGGIMAKAADASGIQFRTLNLSKGPAVRATRAQTDRQLYRAYIRQALQQQQQLQLFQEAVDDIILEGDRVTGVITQSGLRFYAAAVVLTAGTFLAGKIHIGRQNYAAGRAADPSSLSLAQRLREIFPHTLRLKTGTPPRIDRRSVDLSLMQPQYGDNPTPVFSFLGRTEDHPEQVCCYITHTNQQTHQLIRNNMQQSPLYNGEIKALGPRYCPSIEDKVVRFADKKQHQIFVEPEGLTSHELYPNGISTSLPFLVQQQIIHSIRGFEKAHIVRPGYAIEYDFFDPTQLQASLQTKSIKGLFFAGQINGTTGYEEAAAQGLLAGANAALLSQQKPFIKLQRSQAYIGVMIDDLITQGTEEPYRMFTSRAEYRLSLREDNADERLTVLGREFGLVDDYRWRIYETKQGWVNRYITKLSQSKVQQLKVEKKSLQQRLAKQNLAGLVVADLFKRPDWSEQDLADLLAALDYGSQLIEGEIDKNFVESLFKQVITQVYVQFKYTGYLVRQQQQIERLKSKENQLIPADFDYAGLMSLSAEVRQKLSYHQPETIAQASRISGVTPAALSILLVALKQKAYQQHTFQSKPVKSSNHQSSKALESVSKPAQVRSVS